MTRESPQLIEGLLDAGALAASLEAACDVGALPERLGPAEWGSRLSALCRMALPRMLCGRRTVRGVGAYFDLITDDGCLFYSDSFHVGYFPQGTETFEEALQAHTDLVGRLARIEAGATVLDLGCGVGAPAARIARLMDCRVIGVNVSSEQVRRGRALIDDLGLSGQVDIQRGNALALNFPDESFDAVMCLEVAGDICVTEGARSRLVQEIWRVLRPGGHVGFSDLALRRLPTRSEDRALRSVFYHSGGELVEDWAGRFGAKGFRIVEQHDIQEATAPTWDHVADIYASRAPEIAQRYGQRIAARTRRQLATVIPMLRANGTYPALCLQRPTGEPGQR